MGRKKLGHENDIEVKNKLRMKGSDGKKLIELKYFLGEEVI